MFHSKSKFDHCSLIGIVFKVLYKNWVLIGQFLSDFIDLHVILTKIVSQISLFSKSKSDHPRSNDDDFCKLDCVYTMNFSLGGGKVVLQWPSADGPSCDLTKPIYSKSAFFFKCCHFY
jgi:hypothetical protein